LNESTEFALSELWESSDATSARVVNAGAEAATGRKDLCRETKEGGRTWNGSRAEVGEEGNVGDDGKVDVNGEIAILGLCCEEPTVTMS
jgi:hypothetical protein